jgi:hypothetical protein
MRRTQMITISWLMTLQMDKKDMQAHRQRHKTADGGFHSHTL